MKIKVYFEESSDGVHSNGGYAELVAEFYSEEAYEASLKGLESRAELEGYILTESCE